MPIYNYKCQTCEKEFEIILKMDEDITRYPGCDNKDCTVKRIPSSFSPSFVGSGFYVNDYKKGIK